MSVEQEILVTGIKVVDLLAPYAKGGKIGKNYSVVKLNNFKFLGRMLCNLYVIF
jgi:F0F1-type ATP synthase, beta subunit